jgi:hypothetical protein
MATVVRRRVLVNPARRRRKNRPKLSAKQIKYFGTPRQKAALKHRRKRKPATTRAAAHRRRTRPRKKNPGDIISFGLAAANPRRKRRKNAMASTKHRRRRTARSQVSHRRRTKGNPVRHFRVRHRRRAAARRNEPGPRRHYQRRRVRMNRRRHYRRNPGLGAVGGLFVQAAWTIGGAVGTRAITQLALGAKNTGILGYAGNFVTAMLLGWGTKRFLRSPSAASAVVVGGMVALTLRLITDYTPIGKMINLQLSGFGDVGLAGLLPSSYVDPALFTGNDAERVVPSAWRPMIASKGVSGLGDSTYGRSTYVA